MQHALRIFTSLMWREYSCSTCTALSDISELGTQHEISNVIILKSES